MILEITIAAISGFWNNFKMNIKITHNWLLDYLETDATPVEIREYLSLCGPSVESVEKVGNDYVYDIEVISNRIDYASVFGIAQEATAILPMFGKKARLKSNPLKDFKFNKVKEGKEYELKVEIKNPNLVSRFTTIIYDGIVIKDSPDFIKDRLSKIGIKVINNVVDISNYLMLTYGQPIHMFDYDKIIDHKMIVRESKKGEKLVTLDEKEILLPGGDVVIEDGSGKLIDLCGIMGGLNSAINPKTKRVLLFVQTYNKSKIRKTTMNTGQRTIAATFFEKGLDEERVEATAVTASELVEKYCLGNVVSKIQDIYPEKHQNKVIKISQGKFDKLIGIKIDPKTIVTILNNLGFSVDKEKGNYSVTVPSHRKYDITIQEDLIEEVARIYGYHNIPSRIQPPTYVEQPKEMEDLFVFQNRIKTFLKHLGLNEIINYSMISKNMVDSFNLKIENHLRLSNSISEDIEYLRISLLPSLYKNIKNNSGKREVLRFFEIGKIYLPKKNDLPDEIYKLGIVTNTNYFDLKGIVESVHKELNIDKNINFEIAEKEGIFMTEIDFRKLISDYRQVPKFKPINPFAVIKLDKTFSLTEKVTYKSIKEKAYISKLLQKIEVISLFENKLTLRFYYSSASENITEETAKSELAKIQGL